MKIYYAKGSRYTHGAAIVTDPLTPPQVLLPCLRLAHYSPTSKKPHKSSDTEKKERVIWDIFPPARSVRSMSFTVNGIYFLTGHKGGGLYPVTPTPFVARPCRHAAGVREDYRRGMARTRNPEKCRS
ncbi:hypothetical protein J6590_001581 [Homalodisca vitripennis]|nr:hypothetical protein J6590_001581 [Homalodisca vitripennis]